MAGRPKAKQEESFDSNKVYHFRLVGRHTPEIFKLQASNLTVFDPESKKRKAIRYCALEESIFVKEQSENAIRTPIFIAQGVMEVPATQSNLVEFLNIHPGNTKNGGNVFEEVDTVKEALAENELIDIQTDAQLIIRTKAKDGFGELLEVARVLGINTNNPSEVILHDLKSHAKNNPKGFLEMFDSEMVKAKSIAIEAKELDIVDFEDAGQVRWTDNKNMICSVPVGQKHEDILARYMLTDEGTATKNELKRRIDALS